MLIPKLLFFQLLTSVGKWNTECLCLWEIERCGLVYCKWGTAVVASASPRDNSLIACYGSNLRKVFLIAIHTAVLREQEWKSIQLLRDFLLNSMDWKIPPFLHLCQFFSSINVVYSPNRFGKENKHIFEFCCAPVCNLLVWYFLVHCWTIFLFFHFDTVAFYATHTHWSMMMYRIPGPWAQYSNYYTYLLLLFLKTIF